MRRALEGLGGVRGVKVDLASGGAVVEAGAEVTAEALTKAVQGTVILSWARDALARPRRRVR